jgi:hypothetical protein
METATIPVRVNEMQINAPKEGSDDLSIRLSFSTLCMPPDSTAGDGGPSAGAYTGFTARGEAKS